jgi:hypothetical protein
MFWDEIGWQEATRNSQLLNHNVRLCCQAKTMYKFPVQNRCCLLDVRFLFGFQSMVIPKR